MTSIVADINRSVILLAAPCSATNILYHSLKTDFPVEKVVLERPVSAGTLLIRRIPSLGIFTVLGQALFSALIAPALKWASRARRAEIMEKFRLDDLAIPESDVFPVASINSQECLDYLKKAAPRVLVISGTRILSKDLLEQVRCPVLNIHAGITPLYRGVHGGYWALAENNKAACGVTVHLVDPGIDTGGILAQTAISPGPDDNYATYPLLQLAAGLAPLKKALQDALDGRLTVLPPPAGESRLRSHPTLWGYLARRLRHGVK